MKFNEALILERKVSKLLLLDIDDTIVKASDIFIYKKLGGKEYPLTPDEFAKEKVTPETEYMYDFRDFNDAEIVSNSIKKGNPIIPILQYMDHMIGKGYKIGILTARGLEDTIKSTLESWLKYEKKGHLKNIGAKLKEVFAVNDEIKKYKGATSYDKKANVMRDLAIKYDKIIFVDDDQKNIDAVDDMNLRNVKAKNILEII